MKQRQHKLWRALLCPLLLLTLFLTGCGQAAVPASQPPASGTAQQPSFSAPLSSAPLQASAEPSEPAGPAEPSAAEPEVTPPPEGSEAAAAGSSPDEVPWNFDGKTGVLTFEGSGSLSSVEPETADNLSYGWTDLSSDVTSVVIGEGITRIPKFAFYGFQRLQSVSLPSTLTSIGTYAFFQCAFQEIALPDSVESIGAGAFSNCQQLRSCAIPEKVTVLEPSVFGECYALQTITFHEGLAELKESCLWCSDGISSLVIPSTEDIEQMDGRICTIYVDRPGPRTPRGLQVRDGVDRAWLLYGYASMADHFRYTVSGNWIESISFVTRYSSQQ